MDNIVDFQSELKKREPKPDPQNMIVDERGDTYFRFHINYRFNDGYWDAEIWARSFEEVEQRLEAIKTQDVSIGQVYSEIIP